MTECILHKNRIINHSYNYSKSLYDGSYIDVSEIAQVLGFEYRVALSADVWNECIKWSNIDTSAVGIYQSEEKRLKSLLYSLQNTLERYNREAIESNIFSIEFISKDVMSPDLELKPVVLRFSLLTYGDDEEPVLAIIFAKTM